ncbi:hypothetical protein GBZ48_30200 [Azospirillum melinis]|uniref:Uncharacterized protein n=1 Tax=Azospirillum melinis TaxID=328839 RepID=A0ABX2KM88_9PROT|nr:hypothetical protein [Azospirillum melinis]MBP2305991.1 hypothetical protein [Azospirillum melinis]NUB03496.1 hypothetical protein [Azospirillum melinis]
MVEIVELHIENAIHTQIDLDGEIIVATGWLNDLRHLKPGVIVCLHGATPAQGRFIRELQPASDGRLRFELKSLCGNRPWRGRGGPKAGYRWVGEDQSDLLTLPTELTPYRGSGNPPFMPLAPDELFNYPLPSSLNPYARPTQSARQRQFEHDLARIVLASGCRTVPYAFRDAKGAAFRMTATAIDFAAANVFIASPYRGGGRICNVTVIADLDASLAYRPALSRNAAHPTEAQGSLVLE